MFMKGLGLMAKFNLENVIVESVDSKENVKNIFLELISKEPQENNIYILIG